MLKKVRCWQWWWWWVRTTQCLSEIHAKAIQGAEEPLLRTLCRSNITTKREGVVLTIHQSGKRGGTGYLQSTQYSRRGAPGFQPHIQQQGFWKLYDYFVTGMTNKSPFPTICAYGIYLNVLLLYYREKKNSLLKRHQLQSREEKESKIYYCSETLKTYIYPFLLVTAAWYPYLVLIVQKFFRKTKYFCYIFLQNI
jgi:hypothetical protein